MRNTCLDLFYFFFFQAEDGIRDVAVTGVQTCALPICPQNGCPTPACGTGNSIADFLLGYYQSVGAFLPGPFSKRSEERRVGKSVDLGGRRIIKKKKIKMSQLDVCFLNVIAICVLLVW